jgi:pyrimidine-nucleoside phosphorylase
MYDIIEKKKNNQKLSYEEMKYWVMGYVENTIPDYQVSSLLMAICFNGLDDEELTNLTMIMAASGEQIDLSQISGLKVDKHSTGGVGDKTTLIVAPIASACGCKVAKMSGKGLRFYWWNCR